ncbi:MAG: DEAD/DEAH box helicase [Phycisphaerae bacterium]
MEALPVEPLRTFKELDLAAPIMKAIDEAGYEHPTPIQSAAIPLVLAGRDVMGCAQTGTGKTAAFGLPIVHRLLNADPAHAARVRSLGARAIVLCPTRELAVQIEESFRLFSKHTDLRIVGIFGGVHQGEQVRQLRAGVDVLIATPGRLLDLHGQRVARLTLVEVAVLDEADRMMDIGFLPDIRRILAHTPDDRQSLMFSATMPEEIRRLSREILKNPAHVQVSPVSSAAPMVEHFVHMVDTHDKPRLLEKLLKSMSDTKTLIFTKTKLGAEKLSRHLRKVGVRAMAMHGDKTQEDRNRALAAFRSENAPVLVATDVAARGLHVEEITHVINYELPHDAETYVHRIGRTGRAGASGVAISFCCHSEKRHLQSIERLIKAALRKAEPPTGYTPGESGGHDTGDHRGHGRDHGHRSQGHGHGRSHGREGHGGRERSQDSHGSHRGERNDGRHPRRHR